MKFTLNQKEIKRLRKLSKQYPDTQEFTISFEEGSGIGINVYVTFAHWDTVSNADDYPPKEIKLDITDYDTW